MSTRSIKLAQVWCISLDRWRCFRGTHRFFFGDGFWATFENGRFVELKNPWFKIAWSKTSEIRCLSQSLMIGKGDHSIGSINVLTVQEALLELYRIVMKWSKTALQSAPPVQDMEMGKTAKPQKTVPVVFFVRIQLQLYHIYPLWKPRDCQVNLSVLIWIIIFWYSLTHWYGECSYIHSTVYVFIGSLAWPYHKLVWYGYPLLLLIVIVIVIWCSAGEHGRPRVGIPRGWPEVLSPVGPFLGPEQFKVVTFGLEPWTGCITCRNLAMKFYLRSPWHRLLCACWTLSDAHYSASSADAGALEGSSSGSPTGIGLVLERDWFDWNLNPRSWPDWPDDKKSVGCVTCPFLADQK